MDRFYLKALKSRYFLRPLIIISTITCCFLVYYLNINDKIIFPDLEKYSYEYYTDKANGGNSQILKYVVSDSVVKLNFQLNNGFDSPYVGFSITPILRKIINAQKYNQISINILGLNINRVGISLLTLPLITGEKGNQDETLYHAYLNISDKPTTYNIPIKQFQHPDWWADFQQITVSKIKKADLKNILHINIGSAFSPNINQPKSLEIYSIAFTRNNQKLFIIVFAAYILSVSLLFIIQYWAILKKNKGTKITVSYAPLEMANKNTGFEKCIEFINTHYSNSNLSLELIANETAIAPRRITQIIHEKYMCNFKTYLNRIRINESKRFLTQTDLNIGEIAFKVGFNNQSHFNRVFKSELNISPSEFRENHKS